MEPGAALLFPTSHPPHPRLANTNLGRVANAGLWVVEEKRLQIVVDRVSHQNAAVQNLCHSRLDLNTVSAEAGKGGEE